MIFETINQLKEYVDKWIDNSEIKGLWQWLKDEDITDEQIYNIINNKDLKWLSKASQRFRIMEYLHFIWINFHRRFIWNTVKI